MLDFLPGGRCVSKTTGAGVSRLFGLGQLGSLTLKDTFLDELRMRSAHQNFYGPIVSPTCSTAYTRSVLEGREAGLIRDALVALSREGLGLGELFEDWHLAWLYLKCRGIK